MMVLSEVADIPASQWYSVADRLQCRLQDGPANLRPNRFTGAINVRPVGTLLPAASGGYSGQAAASFVQ